MYKCIAALLCYVFCVASAAASDTPKSSGTGFPINSEGWILTNAHVVEKCDRIEVKGFGIASDPRIDSTNDLALVKVDNTTLKPIPFRKSPVRLGEDIVAIGYPLAGLLSDSVKVTTGNVNALAGMRNDTRYIQISTPIQPGNSGGPVTDKAGKLLGITTASLSKQFADEIGITAQNLNFAIRASVAELFLQSQNIRYETTEGTEQPTAMNTADLAERLAPSVFQVLCFGQPEVATAEPTPSGTTASASGQPLPATSLLEATGYDALGIDYSTMNDVSYPTCKATCEGDARCEAITYNSRYNFCFLKRDVFALIRNSDATSAYLSSKASSIIRSNFTVYADTDTPGGDYMRLQKTDYMSCFSQCLQDGACRAFAYVRRKHECWLKNTLGQSRAIKGVELGVK